MTTFTGQLGTPNSKLGSIELGFVSTETFSVEVYDSVTVTDALDAHTSRSLPVSDVVLVSDQISIFSGSITVISSGPTLTLTFPKALRIDGTSNVEHYQLTNLNGGVPTMVLSATPIQDTIDTGSNGTILGPGLISNQFYMGPVPVAAGNYLTIVGRWQTLTARVVSSPSLGIAVLDATLMVDDPNNGSLTWTLLSAVSGVTLTVREPTNGKSYMLAVSDLTTSYGNPYNESVQWLATALGPSILSVEYFGNGDILLTFSDELMIDSGLLNPEVYSIFGPTRVQVTGVSTASSTQVVLKTTTFGTGSYTIAVDQP